MPQSHKEFTVLGWILLNNSDFLWITGSPVVAAVSKARKRVVFFDKRLKSFKYNWGLTKEELPYKTALQFERKAGTTSTPLVEIDEHNKSINAAFVSGDGEIMVSVSLDNTVWTWSNFILPGSKPASCIPIIFWLFMFTYFD